LVEGEANTLVGEQAPVNYAEHWRELSLCSKVLMSYLQHIAEEMKKEENFRR